MNEDYIPSQIILDYYTDPVNYGVLKPYDLMVVGRTGCVISKAGASILTEMVLDKSLKEVLDFDEDKLFESLGGVLQTRTKCAFLGLNILKKVIFQVYNKKISFPKKISLEI